MEPITLTVNPKGWVNPLTIEYVVAQAHKYDTQVSVIWRIKGTTHCFTIYENHLNQISKANYVQHIEEALTNFRYEYLQWFKDPYFAEVDWKYEYQQQYGSLILPDEPTNKDRTSKS